MKKNIFLFSVLIIFFTSCIFNNKRFQDVDVSEINIEKVKIKRYEKALFEINPDNFETELKEISKEYPFFLDANLDNPKNLIQISNYISDPKLIDLYKETIFKYPNLNNLEEKLTSVFKYYKFYFPEKSIPYFYSYISGLQYEYPVQRADSVFIISLDIYLGSDFPPYKQIGLPKYKISQMQSEYIINDCVKTLVNTEFFTKKNNNCTLLDEMIQNGKLLYFQDALQPTTADSIKINYPQNKLEWCFENEGNIWAYFIENNLLYSYDFNETNKYLREGPFTSGFSDDSPARLGVWIGWQIMRSFMENNPGISLKEMLKIKNSQNILLKSKYKPKK